MVKEKIIKLFSCRSVLWDMTASHLKNKYAGSKLGLWWAVIIPLILTLSITLVFNVIFKVNIKNFPLFALAGIIPWLFFSTAITESTNSFSLNAAILHQGVFPIEYVPISSVLGNLLNFLIGFIFLIPLFLVFNYKTIILLPLLILVILLHLFFMIGLSLFLSSLNVFFKDVIHFLSIALMVWFWITPVFYELEMVPFPFRWISLFNPMTYYVLCYRDILFWSRLPDIFFLLICFIVSFGMFVLGYIFMIKKEPEMLKRI